MKIWQLKPLVIVVLTIAACLVIYVSVITRKKTQMSARQKITKAFYPALMAAGKLFGKKTTLLSNTGGAKPSVSFYSLAAKANDGGIIPFSNFAGKKY